MAGVAEGHGLMVLSGSGLRHPWRLSGYGCGLGLDCGCGRGYGCGRKQTSWPFGQIQWAVGRMRSGPWVQGAAAGAGCSMG